MLQSRLCGSGEPLRPPHARGGLTAWAMDQSNGLLRFAIGSYWSGEVLEGVSNAVRVSCITRCGVAHIIIGRPAGRALLVKSGTWQLLSVVHVTRRVLTSSVTVSRSGGGGGSGVAATAAAARWQCAGKHVPGHMHDGMKLPRAAVYPPSPTSEPCDEVGTPQSCRISRMCVC